MAVIASVAAGLALILATGQETTGASTPVPDVTVTGTRDQMVRRYVDVLPEVNRPDEPLARFDRRVCPGVVNMDAHAQAIVDRMGAVALASGLTVGQPGCSPNILVIFTTDADRTAADLRREAPYAFDDVARTRRSGRTQLREFLESDAPVRWWQATTDEPAIASIELSQVGTSPAPGAGFRPSGPVRTRGATLLSSGSRMDINMAVVIVDMSQIEAVDVNAIADYAAFVALGQIDPDADTASMDTVLNLFRPDASRITGLSEFDRGYLRALYRSRGDAARASQQKSEIAAEMLRESRVQDGGRHLVEVL